MRIIKPHDAETDSSRLAEAAAGEPAVTASRQPGGATAVPVPAQAGRRVGFLAGQVAVPPDFDGMEAAEITRLFEGEE